MRLTLVVALALFVTPAALGANPASAPGLMSGTVASIDLSAAKKKRAPKKKTEEYMKAAPSAPPSGGKSTY